MIELFINNATYKTKLKIKQTLVLTVL